MDKRGGGGVAVVAGAGGFVGGHLTRHLLARGWDVRAVDAKPVEDWFQVDERADPRILDLSTANDCRAACDGASLVYNFASDMGGMGFIEYHRALCMLSVLINTNLLVAARDTGVERYLFASSACVYPAAKQATVDGGGLAEDDAYPAMPEDGYGWEKLFGERLCRHFREDFGLDTRVPRYHNVYGPFGTFAGSRAKAPAAICRKVAEAVLTGSSEIEIWGDGRQTRSFTYIDDCVEGTARLMDSEFSDPLNIGSEQLVTVDQLVDMVETIAGTQLRRRYVLDAPQGVRGRNSDNRLIRRVLGWEPTTTLQEGLALTYRWIYDQLLGSTAEAHHDRRAAGV